MTPELMPDPVFSPLIGDHAGERVAHGYFTRKGGVSTGLYAGLNVGLGSDDDRTKVSENRRRVCAWFGAEAERLATLHQVHSPDAVTIDDGYDGARHKADAMVTQMLSARDDVFPDYDLQHFLAYLGEVATVHAPTAIDGAVRTFVEFGPR